MYALELGLKDGNHLRHSWNSFMRGECLKQYVLLFN